jgi:hypothetical protein
MSVSALVALDTKSYEILSRITAQPAPSSSGRVWQRLDNTHEYV